MAEIDCLRDVDGRLSLGERLLVERLLQRGRPCVSGVDVFPQCVEVLVREEIAGAGGRWKRLPGRVLRGLGGEKLVDLPSACSFLP